MITRHYLEGDFREAINGYWSPLLSWLMLPFTGQDFGDIPALKTLQLVIGAGVLWTWTSVLRRSVMPEPYAEALSYAALPFVLAYAFLSPTADLLFLWLTLALFRFLAKGSALTDEQNAKRFAFARRACLLCESIRFSVVLFLLVSEWWQVRASCRETTPFACFGIFLLLIAPWVTAISLKYGHFTISEAAAFNRSRRRAHAGTGHAASGALQRTDETIRSACDLRLGRADAIVLDRTRIGTNVCGPRIPSGAGTQPAHHLVFRFPTNYRMGTTLAAGTFPDLPP